jgi:hypothetical protein
MYADAEYVEPAGMRNKPQAMNPVLASCVWIAGSMIFASPGISQGAVSNTLTTYEIPQKLLYRNHLDDFTVRVRLPGGKWRDLYEYRVSVDQDTHSAATVVMFDFTGEVEVGIQKNNSGFSRVAVRPARIEPRINDGIVYLRLNRPQNLSVEFDGDRLTNLHILATAPIERPQASVDTVFYEPGLHVPPDGGPFFPVRSNQTIYLAGGAVLQGTFNPRNVENVRIIGRGILDAPAEQLTVQSSRNVTIEGLTFLTPRRGTLACASSREVVFRDVRTFSDAQWSDGINVFGCKDVRIERAFIRTSDDSVAIYATRRTGRGSSERIEVRDSIFWPDVAHAMFVGLHGDRDLVADVTFQNIDVLGLDEDDPEYQGVMAVNAGDSNIVRNITFRDIRVDHIEEGKLFNVRVVNNAKYSSSPGQAVENIVFENISYTGSGWASASVLAGYDETRRVRGVKFENIRIAGRRIRDARDWLEIGSYVDDVTVR